MEPEDLADDKRVVTPEHAKTTTVLHGILATLYGLVAVAVIAAFASFGPGGTVMDNLEVIGLFAAVACVIHVVLCYGARRRLRWAKNGTVAVGVLMLLAFPIGTAIGIYLIVQAAKPWPGPGLAA